MNKSSSSWLGYDWFKLAVAILLILLLLLFWRTPGPAPAPLPANPTLTPVNSTDPTAAPPVVAPPLTLDQPGPDDDLTAGAIQFGGQTEPGGTVRVQGNGRPLGETAANADGEWALNADLPAGEAQVIAQALDASGAVLAETPPLSLQIAPAIAAPVAPNPPVINQPTAADALTAGLITVSGTADPGTQILITAGDQQLETETDSNGNWSASLDLPAGDLELYATATDPASGLSAESERLTLSLSPAANSDTNAPMPDPVVSGPCGEGRLTRAGYVVAPCENLTRISRKLDITLTDLLRSNPSITDPDLIFPGQILLVP